MGGGDWVITWVCIYISFDVVADDDEDDGSVPQRVVHLLFTSIDRSTDRPFFRSVLCLIGR